MKMPRFRPSRPLLCGALWVTFLAPSPVFAQHNPIPGGPFAPVLLIWMLLTDFMGRFLGHPLADIFAAFLILILPSIGILLLMWKNPGGFTRKLLVVLGMIPFLIFGCLKVQESGRMKKAFAEQLALAERGDPNAQKNIGIMFRDGWLGAGVPQDHQEAMKWFLKSAEQGFLPSYSALAFMYKDGCGVPKDDVRAYMWICIANDRATGDATLRIHLVEYREQFEKGLSSEQLGEGMHMAREWEAAHPNLLAPTTGGR